MKATKKTISKRQFAEAIISAATCSKSLFKGTKLAYYCGRWLDLNKQIIESFQKERDKLTKKLRDEIDDNNIDHCATKDGVILYGKNDTYQYAPEKLKALKVKNGPLMEQLEDLQTELLKENIEVVVITSDLSELPDNLGFDMESQLNGIVFTNQSPYEEKVIFEQND